MTDYNNNHNNPMDDLLPGAPAPMGSGQQVPQGYNNPYAGQPTNFDFAPSYPPMPSIQQHQQPMHQQQGPAPPSPQFHTGGYPMGAFPGSPIGQPTMSVPFHPPPQQQQPAPTGYEGFEQPSYTHLPPPGGAVPLSTYSPSQATFAVQDLEDLPAPDYNDSGVVPSKTNVLSWIAEGWTLYKRHWLAYSLYTVLVFFVPFVSDLIIGEEEQEHPLSGLFTLLNLLSWPLYFGFFIAGSNEYKRIERGVREGLTVEEMARDGRYPLHLADFFRAYLVFFPLLGIILLCGFFTMLGFICFIIPGVYLGFTLMFAPFIYLEYHKQTPQDAARNATNTVTSYSLWHCVKLSRSTVHPHFCSIVGFVVLLFLLTFLGYITIIGWLVTTPLTALALVPAVRDLFELQLERAPDSSFYLCC